MRNHRAVKVENALTDPGALADALAPLTPMQTAQTVSCSFNTSGNTLVPTSIFQPVRAPQYLAFHVEELGSEKVASDELLLLEARNVYALPQVENAVAKAFPQCRFFHESTVEIEVAMRLARINREDAVYLFFSGDFFRLVYVCDQQLQLANTFAHASEMDVAYYVLYVFDQLGISVGETPTYAAGSIDENGPELNMLREYIGPVKLLRDSALAELNFTPNLPAEAQRFFTLFHQVLCVS